MSKISSESKEYAKGLYQLFKSNENADNAIPMAKYMKGHFKFFGIKSPQRNLLMRQYVKEFSLPPDWKEWAYLTWSYEEREMQLAGMELIYRLKKKIQKDDIEVLEYIITNKSWWDTVDFIASNIMGYYFFTYPDQIKPVCQRWSISDNIWLNRTCLLFQLKYKEYTDFKLLSSFIHRHKYSDEFFIQKAIGWALRQYAKTNSKEVRAFVAETELKRLSRREALKHFS